MPQHEFGRDLIATLGILRHAEPRSVPEIHAELVRRRVPIGPRRVSNWLDRYDELLTLSTSETARLRRITAKAGWVALALDGLQPDVGHKILWVLRDVLSGEVLLVRSLLSSTQDDLAKLAIEVKPALEVPLVGVVSDGQTSIRNAVRLFRYFREMKCEVLIPSVPAGPRSDRPSVCLRRRNGVPAMLVNILGIADDAQG